MSNPTLNMDVSDMSIPAHMVGLVGADWLARLPLVSAEVKSRLTTTPSAEAWGRRATLWNRWLTRNVLDVPAGREVAV
ncbi:MAG TPA: hypothetical protein PLE99_00740 [Candidatus Thiothrix moscowensis]|uniref:hypothetical protein n=1 Tax=unclassified Thiothrix TaxID=2636184 RepID=UPI0025F46C01|nr:MULTISPECIES: hypothetical protein [unclassified Thiothrix]HRJ51262.1 hypothetical protein [Candidatus Thiothrix moscowensis]HRJ91683.1 hypothetical protein [Candidatus Thiothrix moscowensis]